MDNIWKISRLASKFLSIAEGAHTRKIQTKSEILTGLEEALKLIDYDNNLIIQNEQKLRADQADTTFPAEARTQLDQNLKRYLVLGDFLLIEFRDWLVGCIRKLGALVSLESVDDQSFFHAFKNQIKELQLIIERVKSQLTSEGLRLDVAELYSLALVRRILAQQIDAFDRTPTDPVSILKSQNIK